MEVTAENLQTLAGYLEKTLSPVAQERRTAEKFLESIEGNQNYPLLLLHLLDKADVTVALRVSAAITFKNYIKRNWRVVEDSADKIHASDRQAIKTEIVGLMLRSPEQLQKQLSDAISIIGREDFPDKWPDLLGEMVLKFQSGDFHIINGVLRTAHSLFKRYRHEFKSQELWTEIKYVLDSFASPLTELFKATMGLAETHANDSAALSVIFSSLVLICKLFYSLNFQDIPEFFEDNMAIWMKHFLTLLTLDNKLLNTQEDEEAGLLEMLRSQICDNITMYAQKYESEFRPYLPDFVTVVWNLLVTTGPQVKYDLLVSNAIQFLASVADRAHYKNLFEEMSTLTSICEKVIVPNIECRTADEEQFEDNAEEYIRRDIEGSDFDTRRRSACDLVRSLCRFFDQQVTQIFSQYVQVLLQQYAKNPSSNWKCKDTAIFLVTSVAAKAQTAKHGITQTSELVNVADFFTSTIAPELQSENIDQYPVLKADCIKYVMTFRNQLPKEVLVACVPLLVALLKAQKVVVHSYASYTIERLFTVKDQHGKPMLSREDVSPHAELLLVNMFSALSLPGSSENEYIMKGIMRSMSLLQELAVPYVPAIIPKLNQILLTVAKNPSKPHFNHYLFESLSLSIRITCKANPQAISSFEAALFPPFQEILQLDVQEFICYMSVICLSLAEFIHAALLGVFQKLIASKSNDHEGFYLVGSIVRRVRPETIDQYMKQIFLVLFQRLTSSKTTKYIKGLLVFFSLFAWKRGTDTLIHVVDSIQPKMFGMVLERLYVAEVQKVTGQVERKICAVGMTRLLTECPAIFQGDYAQFWPSLLQALIGLFELPTDDTLPDDEHFIEIDDTPAYQTAYSQLVFAGKPEHDLFEGSVPDAKLYLAKQLHKLSTQFPGQVSPKVTAGLQANAAQFLQAYLQRAGITLV
ncbi:PREDICTED: exportin-2-like [Priapulus caudatus]|uniref:Exportin-2 n=1 Tax=Priapulus caudatus TaxID=37621 RepID=A0ABM1EBP1_PRICU|nr:PREDICTED: exportin-2-like [Priapulus caudatus]